MSNFWRVAFFEYQRGVLSRSFWIELLSLPVMMVAGVGLMVLLTLLTINPLPVGVVDQAAVLPREPVGTGGTTLTDFVPFRSEPEARTALEAGRIQAYYLLPADYLDSGRADLVYIKRPGSVVPAQFKVYLQANLLTGRPPEIVERAISGMSLTVRSLDGQRSFSFSALTLGLFLPLVVSMGFMYLLSSNAGYFLSVVVDEKENRTLEVLVNSLSPAQLIGGKIAGIIAVNLTMLGSWGAMVLTALVLFSPPGSDWIGLLAIDWRSLIAVALVAIPSYLLVAALMTGVGGMVPSGRDGQPVNIVVSYLHTLPVYLILLILKDPDGTLAVVLSLLPFTSLATLGIRSLVVTLPAWQVAASLAVQTVCALGGVWLAGRAFRAGMLLYGKRLKLSALFRR